MPVLTADDGAFNNILILGLDNCYKLMHKKLVQNTMGDQERHKSIFLWSKICGLLPKLKQI